MKRSAIAATAALMVILLSGCSTPAAEPAPAPTADAAAPLTAETPTVEPAGGDAAYLATVREALPDDTVIPDATDEQLLAAGREACERMAAGEDGNAMSVIEGEKPTVIGSYNDSGPIVRTAVAYLCP